MRAPNPSTAQALVLVDELARLGVTEACLSPGSRSAPLALALHDDPRVRVHVGIDERSVAFLALGMARAASRPAVVVSTSGTAAVNFHPAVVEAHQSRVPLLVLTADRPPELRHAGANQTIDQVGLYGRSVRWSCDLGVAEDRAGSGAYWRSTVDHAWARATGAGGPPGPVHVNVAFREPLVPLSDDGRVSAEPFRTRLDGRDDGRPWTELTTGPRPPPPGVLERVAGLAATTERGVVVVGDTSAHAAPLVALSEHLGWPLLAEPLSGARAGDNAVSTYDALLAHGPFARDHRPELVLRVGRVALSRSLLGWLDAEVPQILLDRDAAWLDPGRSLRQVVATDPATAAAAIADASPPREVSAWLESWRSAEGRARAAVDAVLDADERPSEPRTARDLAAALPDGATLVAASSLPVRELDGFMAPRWGLRILGNRGASGIDGFVSTALGVALAAAGPVAALAGDLSLLHDQNGFLLLGERPDLTVVVLNNDGGGIFNFLPQAALEDSFERLFGTPHGYDLAALAGLHGLTHERLDRAGDLAPAVAAGLGDGGIRLLEVRTDRRENVVLHRQLRARVAAALT